MITFSSNLGVKLNITIINQEKSDSDYWWIISSKEILISMKYLSQK
jgi:hypothetical protein